MRVRQTPARLELKEAAGKLTATVRPASDRELYVAAGGIVFGLALVMFVDHVPILCQATTFMQVVAAFTIAVMLRRLVYFFSAAVDVTADSEGLRVRYPNLHYEKFYPADALTLLRLTDEERSPLAGINMGPLGGNLWLEADGRYVSFGRGLSEADARTLADKINAVIGK